MGSSTTVAFMLRQLLAVSRLACCYLCHCYVVAAMLLGVLLCVLPLPASLIARVSDSAPGA